MLAEPAKSDKIKNFFEELPACVASSAPSDVEENEWQQAKADAVLALKKICDEQGIDLDLDHLSMSVLLSFSLASLCGAATYRVRLRMTLTVDLVRSQTRWKLVRRRVDGVEQRTLLNDHFSTLKRDLGTARISNVARGGEDC